MIQFKQLLLTALLALAITFTFSCSGDDGGGNNNPSESSNSSKESCITAELAIKANTLDDVAKACNASRSEVLSQLPSSIGTCNKTDLDFSEPLRDVMDACGITEITIVSSSSNGSSSSSGGNSSSSNSVESGTVFDGDYFIDPRDNKRYKYKTINGRIWMSENLNYSKGGTIGYCYKSGATLGTAGENGSGCDSPNGRTYTYAVAMDGNASQDKARGICPAGWHIPNAAEWGAVGTTDGDFYVKAGNYDSKNGWSDRNSFGFYWLSNANSFVFMTGGIEVRQEQNIATGNYFSVRCVIDETSSSNSDGYCLHLSECHSDASLSMCNVLGGAFFTNLPACQEAIIISGTFTDVRDGKIYEQVKIGTQTWMAENLNYETASGSKCYNNDPSNCNLYGRLYNWATATDGVETLINNKGICPSGWKLPHNSDWEKLINYVGGTSTAGAKLKTISGWNSNYGTDEYSFAALPGGSETSNSLGNYSFSGLGTSGSWWSYDHAYYDILNEILVETYTYMILGVLNSISVDKASKDGFHSVRCVRAN